MEKYFNAKVHLCHQIGEKFRNKCIKKILLSHAHIDVKTIGKVCHLLYRFG